MLELLNYFFNFNIELFSYPNLILVIAGLFWLFFASIEDLRRREVENWWTFSFLFFALGFRLFFSLINWDFSYFLLGVFGFLAFLLIALVFYYGRIFAGGDFKMLAVLGVILVFSSSIKESLMLFLLFFIILFFVGGVYGLGFSIFLAIKDKQTFKQEFSKLVLKGKKFFLIFLLLAIGVFLAFLGLDLTIALVLGAIFLLFPFLFSFAKAVEKCSLMKLVKASELTLGDWLVKPVRVGGKIIKPNWEGLDEKELELLRNYKGKVLVKYGLPFVPVFLITFIVLLVLI